MYTLSSVLLAMFLVSTFQGQVRVTPISDSDAIDLAGIIARDEGYDLRIQTIDYSFDMAIDSGGHPIVPGYTSVIFEVNAVANNLIAINNSTGQAIEVNSCQVFDYPDVKPFQEQMMRINKAKKKTAQELADDVDCGIPTVLTKPVHYAKQK